jgi:hypothetical protein
MKLKKKLKTLKKIARVNLTNSRHGITPEEKTKEKK